MRVALFTPVCSHLSVHTFLFTRASTPSEGAWLLLGSSGVFTPVCSHLSVHTWLLLGSTVSRPHTLVPGDHKPH